MPLIRLESKENQVISSSHILNEKEIQKIRYIIIADGCLKKIDLSFSLSQSCQFHISFSCIAKNKGSIQIFLKNDVSSHSPHCVLSQTVNGIVLDSSSIQVTPVMNIATSKINASHSIHIGRVEKDKIFYLMNKGFCKEEAISLLIKSLVE
ncbi:MAG: SufD family Fe-S cluster assembly protein [Mycoplasmataceae bacterium]|jgi:Fe-S cluster assembly scaffold protein SufB|nr:SufD family Fe-S cluster assembly protein [Mycoplasmataceae bacterium]